MNRTRIGVSMIFFFLAALALILCGSPPSTSAGSTYTIARTVQYSFTVENGTDRLLKKGEFWTYGPVKRTATQRCVKVESSHRHELIVDDLGNQVLHFTVQDLPPYGTKIIVVKADLLLSDTPNPISASDLKRFLRPEKYVESDNPALARVAKRLRAEKPLETAEKIFRWVSASVRYAGYLRNERGALYALKNRTGDCTEFMDLFAALSRANGIPARRIGGYVCRESGVVGPDDYHNWAEFYDGAAWRIADPQRKVFMEGPSRYVAIEIIAESPKNPMGTYHRVRVSGDGLKVKMNG